MCDYGPFVKCGGDFDGGPLGGAEIVEKGVDIDSISDVELARC